MSDDKVVSKLDFSGKRHLGVMLILFSAFLFSPVGVFSEGVDADAWSVLFWRGVFAGVAGLVYLLVTGRLGAEWCRLRRNARLALLVVALQTAATAAFISSFKLTSVANVALVWGTSPVVAALIAWLFLRERVTISFVVAVGLVILGNAIMVSASAAGHGGTSLAGDALALLMTVLLVIVIAVYRYCPDLPSTIPPFLSSFALAIIALLLIDPMAMHPHEIGISALSGITFVMACATMFEGSKYLAPGEAALLGITEIPWAIILAVLVLSEYPTRQTLVGGVIIMTAVVWYQWRDLRATRDG